MAGEKEKSKKKALIIAEAKDYIGPRYEMYHDDLPPDLLDITKKLSSIDASYDKNSKEIKILKSRLDKLTSNSLYAKKTPPLIVDKYITLNKESEELQYKNRDLIDQRNTLNAEFYSPSINPKIKQKQDEFIKEGNKLKEWYFKKGVDAEVLPVYKQDSSLIKEKLANLGVEDDVALFGHSGDKLAGLDLNWWNENLSKSKANRCILGSCGAENHMMESLKDIPNIYHTVDESWKGVNPYGNNIIDAMYSIKGSDSISPAPIKGKDFNISNVQQLAKGGPIMAGKKKSIKKKNAKLAIGGKVGEVGMDALLESLGSGVDAFDPMQISANLTGQENLQETLAKLKSAEGKISAGSIAKGAAKGALAGTAINPGVGTLIGGVAGAGTALLSRLFGAKGRKQDRNDLVTSANTATAGIVESNTSRFGYQKGGKIQGAGTGKSDSIDAKVPKGSFIVPSENSELAMQIGTKILGWKQSEKATIRQSGKEVDLSNGEVMFSPAEYKTLISMGINVDDLAPEANQTDNKQTGGLIEELNKKNQETLERDISSPLNNYVANAISGIDKEIAGETFPDINKASLPSANGFPKVGVGAYVGAGQAVMGALGLAMSDNPERLTVSDDLNALVKETEQEAQYGYEPEEMAKAKRDIARNVSTALSKTGSEFAGSPASTYNRVSGIMAQGNEDIAALISADQGAMRAKKADARAFKLKRSDRKDYIQGFEFQDARANQGLLADVFSAGVDNVVGSIEYQKYLEAKKYRDKLTNLNSSLITT